MQAFAELLDSLSFQPARNAKLRLIETYLRAAPDPDRGWALAALTGGLDFPAAKPALLRGFGQDKIGAELFALSYDYVGDLAETLALIWETDPAAGPPPSLGEVVETLQRATKTADAGDPEALAGRARFDRPLGAAEAADRRAARRRLGPARQAGRGQHRQPAGRCRRGDLARPRAALPAAVRLAAARTRPGRSTNAGGAFLPPMLANPIDRAELDALDPAHFRAEWKWDGIRVQVAASGGVKRLYSRAGEDISGAFPGHRRGDRFRGRVRRRAAGAPRGGRGAVQRPAAAAEPQERDAQDAEGASRARPALRRAVPGGRGSAHAVLRRAPRPAGGLDGAEAAPALRPLAAGAVQGLGRISPRCARRRGTTASRG